ncbi:hypothetical protein PsYK624_042060 [Phanerochaete sordida]|uniref:Uncharacterized protein n=1 Tax=Phanerochaete sordida TaxID=48140 RepID=A0A9P3LBJ1_9APHY|nr:hypothetical protein PsYK624_042060 [Phanerochaete sordida]
MAYEQASDSADLHAILAYQQHQLRLRYQEAEAAALRTAYLAALSELKKAHRAFAEATQKWARVREVHAAHAAWLCARKRVDALRSDVVELLFIDIIDSACKECPLFKAQFDALDPHAAREALAAAQAAADAGVEAQIRNLEHNARINMSMNQEQDCDYDWQNADFADEWIFPMIQQAFEEDPEFAAKVAAYRKSKGVDSPEETVTADNWSRGPVRDAAFYSGDCETVEFDSPSRSPTPLTSPDSPMVDEEAEEHASDPLAPGPGRYSLRSYDTRSRDHILVQELLNKEAGGEALKDEEKAILRVFHTRVTREQLRKKVRQAIASGRFKPSDGQKRRRVRKRE